MPPGLRSSVVDEVFHGLLDDGSLRVAVFLALFLEGINDLLRDAE